MSHAEPRAATNQLLMIGIVTQKKPYSAITVQVDRLTSEQYEEDDLGGIIDLVEVIRIQGSGPTEAARALRKKLKYGTPHKQIRALVILDGLIENAGGRFQRTFADEPLLERLRLMARDEAVDPQVRQKCKVLFVQWANNYKTTPGLERVANLYKEFPKTQRPASAREKVLKATDPFGSPDDAKPTPVAEEPSRQPLSPQRPTQPAGPSRNPVTLTPTSSGFSHKLFKDKKSSGKPFNLSKEKENMTNAIAQSSMASTNLLNGLQLINRETERVSDNKEVTHRFETCKQLRRKILFYIQHVESDTWIGSLVNANDELIKALTAYEIMDRSISDDSDSDGWDENGARGPKPAATAAATSSTEQQLAGLTFSQSPPTKPPRPAPPPTSVPLPPKPSFPGRAEDDVDAEDEEDPFGDSNAAGTPYSEGTGMTWR